MFAQIEENTRVLEKLGQRFTSPSVERRGYASSQDGDADSRSGEKISALFRKKYLHYLTPDVQCGRAACARRRRSGSWAPRRRCCSGSRHRSPASSGSRWDEEKILKYFLLKLNIFWANIINHWSKQVRDFGPSWRDGTAFIAVVNSIRPGNGGTGRLLLWRVLIHNV